MRRFRIRPQALTKGPRPSLQPSCSKAEIRDGKLSIRFAVETCRKSADGFPPVLSSDQVNVEEATSTIAEAALGSNPDMKPSEAGARPRGDVLCDFAGTIDARPFRRTSRPIFSSQWHLHPARGAYVGAAATCARQVSFPATRGQDPRGQGRCSRWASTSSMCRAGGIKDEFPRVGARPGRPTAPIQKQSIGLHQLARMRLKRHFSTSSPRATILRGPGAWSPEFTASGRRSKTAQSARSTRRKASLKTCQGDYARSPSGRSGRTAARRGRQAQQSKCRARSWAGVVRKPSAIPARSAGVAITTKPRGWPSPRPLYETGRRLHRELAPPSDNILLPDMPRWRTPMR